jgi:hypothetical protein
VAANPFGPSLRGTSIRIPLRLIEGFFKMVRVVQKQAEARKPERALALSVFSLESEYSSHDQADREERLSLG